ncbi:MAG TPA: lanthionine synthetase LanC family protein [Chitinophaga sp.]|uniref:lanthionine synthetase LanC family protein n=1 Tax=Chitinophaga sp. TaxID=1869181 RepID=UPI002CEA1031|nr:lanthionine synthetase LanC family protein [Chitinophaga sp.]HVI44507.1 lanthionine synthetase LanC family protein [Chitinophaga sp.]
MKSYSQQTLIYRDIVKLLNQRTYSPDYKDSLFKGAWGALFYLFYYEQYIDDKENHAYTYLEQLYDEFDPAAMGNYSYCTGSTGPFWLLHHLNKHNFIDIDINDLTTDFMTAAMIDSECYLSHHDFDFLHGSAGICHFLLEFADRHDVREHLGKFVMALKERSYMTEKGRSMPVFFMLDPTAQKGIDAFSLAHGACSLQILLTKIFEAGIMQQTCKQLIEESMEFILSYKNPDSFTSLQALFPDKLDGYPCYDRLSWCYGDLSVAWSLWYCGKYFKEDRWMRQALEIMHHNRKRNTENTSGIVDTCLCHGSSGAATMYRRFWYETNDKGFYNCAIDWHQLALKKIVFPDENNIHGIKSWRRDDKQWDYCWDLLDGSCGVGLSLISHTHPAPLSWDEFLLLS